MKVQSTTSISLLFVPILPLVCVLTIFLWTGRVSMAQDAQAIDQIGSYDPTNQVTRVAVEGTYAYAVGADSLYVVNLADPANPTQVGEVTLAGDALGIAVEGRYAYVAAGAGGLHIVNIADPTTPTAEGGFALTEPARDVAVQGGYAYVAAGAGGLYVVNIADPTTPEEVGTYVVEGNALAVEVSGNYAYVAADTAGLRIINIIDPTNPVEVGAVSTGNAARDVVVVGRTAYVAAGTAGLRVINIAARTSPNEIGTLDTPGSAVGVAVAGTYAYVADQAGGVRVINIAEPARPLEAGFYDTIDDIDAVAALGSYAYIIDRVNGLLVLRFAEPAPTVPVPRALSAAASVESVLLTWESGLTDGTFRYHIYRQAANETTFTRLTTTPTTALSYRDTDVVNETGYRYYVTAVSGAGSESPPSTDVSVIVGQMRLVIPNLSVEPGETVIVPIRIENAEALCLGALNIAIQYDPDVVSLVSLESAPATDSYALTQPEQSTDNQVYIGAVSNECEELTGSATLFLVTFEVAADATTTSLLRFIDGDGVENTVLYAQDDLTTPLPLTLINGQLTFSAEGQLARGDVNGDGEVHAADAVLLSSILSGAFEPSPEQFQAADVNEDGAVTVADVSLLFFFAENGTWVSDAVIQPTATEIRVAPETVSGTVGLAVDVPIRINDGSGVAGSNFIVEYGTGLSHQSTRASDNIPLVSSSVVATNTLRIGVAGSEPLAAGEQTLAWLRFQVNDDALDNTTHITVTQAQMHDQLGRDFVAAPLERVVSTGAGRVRLSVPGDANGDATVDAGDISAIVLRIFSNQFLAQPGADANGDGQVDAGDISCIVLRIFEDASCTLQQEG